MQQNQPDDDPRLAHTGLEFLGVRSSTKRYRSPTIVTAASFSNWAKLGARRLSEREDPRMAVPIVDWDNVLDPELMAIPLTLSCCDLPSALVAALDRLLTPLGHPGIADEARADRAL
jgi:hypothetical protein